MSRREFDSRDVAHWAVAALLVVLGLCLRLYGLDMRSLWHDESHSIAFIRAPASMMNTYLRLDDHPPLYYWLLRGWQGWITPTYDTTAWASTLVGDGNAFRGRMLSALFSAATLPFAYWLARRLAGRAAALAALALIAVSPFAIHYGQELRMYALESLFVAIMMALAPAALKQPTTARVGGVLLFGTLAMYTHYFAALFVIGFLAVLATIRREGEAGHGRAAIRASGGALFCTALYIPWLVPGLEHVLVNSLGGMKSASHFAPRDMRGAFREKGIQATLGFLPDFPMSGFIFPDPGSRFAAIGAAAATLAAGMLLAVAGGIIVLRKAPEARRFAIAFIGVPWAIAIVYELLGGRFYERFLTPVLPAGFALAAAGIWSIPGRWIKCVLLGAVLATMGVSSGAYLRVDMRDVTRDAAEDLARVREELWLKDREAFDAPMLHASAHSFWNMRAYETFDRHEHRFLPSPDVPALARLMYGKRVMISGTELKGLNVVWVGYSAWGGSTKELRARTELRALGKGWRAEREMRWGRGVRLMEIVLYRKASDA